jgi:signal transduction histidine kinase
MHDILQSGQVRGGPGSGACAGDGSVSGPLTLLSGIITAGVGVAVLVSWVVGFGPVGGLVSGWRPMVPGTAFGFACVGAALCIAGGRMAAGTADTAAIRALAGLSMVVPLLTTIEIVSGVRWGVESWFGAAFPLLPEGSVSGRMSPVTASCFLLIGTALMGLTIPGRFGTSAVGLAGGAALTMSWFAVLAVSFESTRLANLPAFPNMAALTIALFALAAAGALTCSTQAVDRLRDADADVLLSPVLLLAAFALPLVLGQLRAQLDVRLAPGLAVAFVTVVFALAVTLVIWTGAARLQSLRQQRELLLSELEARVTDRTRALAQANGELQRSQERLREADRRKDEFLATLAHELRNPLAPIRTGIELLKSPTLPPADATRALSVLERQVAHLVRLIDDLLDVSRITADKLTLQRERVDIAEIITQAIDTSRPALTAARHQLTVEVPPGPIVVVGDATRLTQVVANLLLNACKYTPKGGTITVTAIVAGGRVEVAVADNGIGIPPQFLPRLFEKFSQVAPAIDRAEGGLGLGLALVRGIVTLHGGEVEVRSGGSGHGSTFLIRLPLDGRPQLAPSAAPPHQVAPGAARRVLVVDDSADNLSALSLLLRQRGHDVATAPDGEAALVEAERFRPDVVLLDIGMPKMNGFEVCRRLRGQPWGRAMRVIAQTGWGQLDDRRRTEEAGFDGHLVKPLDPDALDRLLRT